MSSGLVRHAPSIYDAARFYRMQAHEDDAPSRDEVWAYWVNELQRNIDDDYDNVFLVTGPPSSAKSTFAQRSALALDRSFGPRRITWTARELVHEAREAERGQAIIYDEAVTGLLSTDAFSAETKDLVRLINVIRAKNLTFYLCIPDIWDMAKAFRARRADFWLECRRRPRGYGLMHVRDYRTPYQPTTNLPLWAHKTMNPVRWDSLVGTPYWEQYLAEKHERIDKLLADQEESMDEEAPSKARNWKSDDQLEQMVSEYWRSGKPMDQAYHALNTSPNRIILIAERLGIWHRERPPRKRWDAPPVSPG